MGKVKVMKQATLENRVKNLSDMTIRYYEQNLAHFLRYFEELTLIKHFKHKVKRLTPY